MILMRVRIILLLLPIFVLAAALPVKAYWLESKPKSFTMRGVRETAPPSDTKKGVLTLQDNSNLFTRQDDNSPFLLPYSDYFVPADIINTNLPIFGIFSQPVKPAGDPIANLIYANLKLKKLLEDYTKLQEKAKELLNNQYSAISSGKMQTIETISVSQKLHQLSVKLPTINTNEVTSEVSSSKTLSSKSKTKNLVISLQHFKEKQYIQHNTLTLGMDKASDINRTYINKKEGFPHKNQLQQPAIPKGNACNNTLPASGKSPAFFISNLPSIIFKYLLTHKFEALFMIFFISLFINILFGSRS